MSYDVDQTSHAQCVAMQINKNSDLGRLGEHQASRSRKCLSCAYFCRILTYRDDTNGRLVKRKCPPYRFFYSFGGLKTFLVQLSLPSYLLIWMIEKRWASQFDDYSAILFQIASGLGQSKHFNVHVFQATSSRRTLTCLEQLVETFASGFSVSCETFAVPCMHQDC